MKLDLFSSYEYRFGASPEVLISAPGRINIIGEHTDYNGGLVMPAAVDRAMTFLMRRNSTPCVRIYSAQMKEEVRFDMHNLDREQHSWSNYLKGIVSILHMEGYSLSGVDCLIDSDIPIGSGLSSSSALEMGWILGLDHLYGLGLDRWQMIDISQRSNHNYLGIKGGFMDQFACLYGKSGHAMLLDCADRSFDYIDVDLNPKGYTYVLINSNVKHDHLTSGYNDRTVVCGQILDALNRHEKSVDREIITYMSDLTIQHLMWIDKHIDPKLSAYAHYVIQENQRVIQLSKAMHRRDIDIVGRLLYASHEGLRSQYRVSCAELDILVNLASQMNGVAGARMMGGGFGGCTINLIRQENAKEVSERIISEYYSMSGIHADIIHVSLSDGAKITAL